MAVMLKKRACPWGYMCCDFDEPDVKRARRRVRRVEKQAWQREVRQDG